MMGEQARWREVRVRRWGASFSGEFSLDNMARGLAGDVEVLVPLDGLVDAGAEKARLEKELTKSLAEHARMAQKLANPQFVARAPLEVLDKDRARLTELNTAIEKLEAALGRIAAPPA